MALNESLERALVDLVRGAARDEAMPRFRRLDDGAVRAKSAADDLVTEADLAVERAVRDGVQDLLPDAAFVGEEAVAGGASLDGPIAAETCVVLDPIDGTWNYANGIAAFGTMLAVLQGGQTVLGLLYDPVMDDWILARRGGGAWMCRPDAAPVRLSTAPQRSQAEMTGYASVFTFPADLRDSLAAPTHRMRRVTSLRCACHEYRLLAQGRVDFALHGKLNVWDHAAGVLAVTEAGGAARLLDGRAYEPAMTEGRLLVASGAETLADLGATFARAAGPE